MHRDELLATLRSARAAGRGLDTSAAAVGAPTVLDRMLATAAAPEDLMAALHQHTGVAALADASAARGRVDWQAVPRQACIALASVPLRWPGEPLVRIGVSDPWDDALVQRLAQILGRVPELVAVSGAVLRDNLSSSPGPAQSTSAAMAQTPATDDSDVVGFVDVAIAQGLALAASDIHFECDRLGVAVKFRQDGVLTPWRRLNGGGSGSVGGGGGAGGGAGTASAEQVISRIKVLAQLDITERRVPQDGRFHWRGATGEGPNATGVDMRVSIMPSIHGEDAVLRLLDKAQLRQADRSVSLDALGFAGEQVRRIRALAALPHGMLLVTGPTGSGKTTTVYAALSEVNTGLEKIVTIEDPVEYELAGVLQIPVNERKGLTFAKGLRSILRHDPDRILVGEIRDAETAEIAVQSALTGHQVFTTVHANSIFDVVGRFRHFGLDMFGFVSSLNGVIVQRLLRRLCRDCAASTQADAGASGPTWRAVGCPQCRGTGYRGRLVVAEVHLVDDHLRDLVTAGAAMSALREHVGATGGLTLAQQGVALAAQGQTTYEELRRVVGPV